MIIHYMILSLVFLKCCVTVIQENCSQYSMAPQIVQSVNTVNVAYNKLGYNEIVS